MRISPRKKRRKKQEDRDIVSQTSEKMNGRNNSVDIPSNSESEDITSRKNSVDITSGNNSVDITSGNNSFDITSGNNSFDITSGNNSVDITSGNNSVDITSGNNSFGITSKNNSVEITSKNNSVEIVKKGGGKKGSNQEEYLTDEEELEKETSQKMKKRRMSYKVVDKIFHVNKMKELEKTVPSRQVINRYSKISGLEIRLLRKWKEDKNLEKGVTEKMSKFRVNPKGRPLKLKTDDVDEFKKWVVGRELEEKQIEYIDVKEWWMNEKSIALRNYEITRLLKRCNFKYRAKTNKTFLSLKKNEVAEWRSFCNKLDQYETVILINNDEKPIRILQNSDKSVTTGQFKNVSFKNGGRSAKKTNTLDIGTFVVLRWGKIVFYGKCGMGMLLKCAKKRVKNPDGSITIISDFVEVPLAWNNRRNIFGSALLGDDKEFICKQCPTGVMRSTIYPEYLELHISSCSRQVSSFLKITEKQLEGITKFVIVDNHGSHADKIGSDLLKNFWKEKNKLGWKEVRIPNNGSDFFQPNDLAVNAHISNLYRSYSRKWTQEDHKTNSGNFQLPGQKELIKFYLKIWRDFNVKVVKVAWLKVGIGKDEKNEKPRYEEKLKLLM